MCIEVFSQACNDLLSSPLLHLVHDVPYKLYVRPGPASTALAPAGSKNGCSEDAHMLRRKCSINVVSHSQVPNRHKCTYKVV